jgi:hypothetical protein
MRSPTLGAKANQLLITVRNADTVAIPAGAVASFNANNTNDGVDVVNIATAAANQQAGLFAGIAPRSISAGAVDDIIAYGLVLNAKITLMTRSASTISYVSYPAIAVGDILQAESVNGGLSRSTAGTANSDSLYPWIANFAMPSQTSLASGATLTASVGTGIYGTWSAVSGIGVYAKVFVRSM